MIVLFTDFGLSGPYTGQLKMVLQQQAPGHAVIDLFADAPMFNPRASAYLLAAYAGAFPEDSVFLCVVDPGVGSERHGCVVRAGGYWFVGPDNGLFNVLLQRFPEARWWDIEPPSQGLSDSFHGRDWFAPVAARLAGGELPGGVTRPLEQRLIPDWPADLAEIVYIDHYGNAITGLRQAVVAASEILEVKGRRFCHGRTFSSVAQGEGLWYVNANGLVEIAVNCGRVDMQYQIAIGDQVERHA
jgi:S-adenosylmethionine hydrolase